MATQNQKKAFENTLKTIDEGKKIDMGDIMVQSGYSEATAINPGKNLLNTKGWNDLMEDYLPDDLLLKVHKEGLNASKKLVVNGKDVGIEEPDFGVRHKYLDTAYKIKSKLKENPAVQINVSATDKIRQGNL